jgi:hypothetical protein
MGTYLEREWDARPSLQFWKNLKEVGQIFENRVARENTKGGDREKGHRRVFVKYCSTISENPVVNI